jgi:hypothetical protein
MKDYIYIMSSEFYHIGNKTTGWRTHTHWLDNSEHVEVVNATLPNDVKSGESSPYSSDKKPASKRVDTSLAKASKTGVNHPIVDISLLNLCVHAVAADDKEFEVTLAVPDPYSEARLDFLSSDAYYASHVYKARAGTQIQLVTGSIPAGFQSGCGGRESAKKEETWDD